MLTPSLTTWRLVLHVLAATIWVGGQFTLLAALSSLRAVSDDATKAAARAFSRIAWPAFAVLVITGLWNISEVDVSHSSTAYQITLFVKITVAIASGVGAAVHQFGTSKVALAIGGSVGGLAAIGAVFLGILLGTPA